MTGDDLDEDMLLQEARQQHAKIRSTTLGRSRGRTDSHTPIKEEEIEDDFEDGASNSKSKHSKGTSNI